MIEKNHAMLSVARQCELIRLSRASYYRIIEASNEEKAPKSLEIMNLIVRHPFYGSRQMCSYLRRQGHTINRKKVQRLMRLRTWTQY